MPRCRSPPPAPVVIREAGAGTKKVTAGCRGGGREPGWQDVRGETTLLVNNFDPNDVAAKR